MPRTVITVERESPTNSSSRSNSFTDEGSSSGTGVHVSHTSGSQEDSDLLDDQSWDPVYSDEIEPSESASRPRPTHYRRSDSRQRSVPRGPLRRHTTTERTIHRPPLSRIHRHAAPNPPSSVDPQEEYPGYGRGYLPPGGPYGGRAPQPGYAPSLASFSPNPFGGNAGPVMPYGSPTYPYPQNPFSPSQGVGAQGYFPPHHQTSPHGAPGYGHEMMPYGQTAGYGYSGYGLPPQVPPSQFYAQFVQPHPPSPPSKPASAAPAPPPEKSEAEKKVEELQKALQDAKLEAERTKQEAERIKRETEEKKVAALMEAEKKRREAEEKKLAALERLLEDTKHDAERHKKLVEERAAADKKAADEAAANEVTDKKVKEAVEKAKAEAEKKTKEAEEAKTKAEEEKKVAEEAKKKAEEEKKALTAPKDDKKKPIKFKDAVGRKFSFPFHLCQTWQGMEDLIRQAFLHVDVIGPHVADGHYDLVGPNGEIILPQVWETMIEPDWAITMHMWPMPERPKAPPDGIHIVDAAPPGHARPLSGGRRRADRPGPHPGGRRGPPPPPPPGWIGPLPTNNPGLPPDDIIIIEDNTTRSSKKKSKDSSGVLGGIFGSSSKPSKSGKGRSKKG